MSRKSLLITIAAITLTFSFLLPSSATCSEPLEYGPYNEQYFFYYIFWIPCKTAGDQGIAVKVLYPKQPRYEDGAPIAIFVAGGVKPGFLGFYSPDFNPYGMIWITFIFPGGRQVVNLPDYGEVVVNSGGTYDYRGNACFQALKAVIDFASGKIANTAGKKISDYVSYPVLTDNIGLYGSSYGGVTAILTLLKYGSELSNVKYVVFYESPATNFLTTTDLGRVGSDPDPEVDADGDGLPWNDFKNPNYQAETCNETWCYINFSTLRYDATLGFYLDNNGNGQLDYIGEPPLVSTDIDGSGAVEGDEDFLFSYWSVVVDGTERKAYSYLVTKAADELGLMSDVPKEALRLDEAYDFWYERDMGFHYDEIAENVSWIKVMQLGFLKEHMCPAPDYPNIVINYNAFKKRGFWIRLNPDKAYLDNVTGRDVDWQDNDANLEISFDNIRDHVISDLILNGAERKLIEVASMLEMADRVYYNDWSANLDVVLAQAKPSIEEEAKEALENVWVSIGPDGGDNYFVFVTSKHTVIAATANSAFRSTDGAATWCRITEENLIDVGFTAMAEVDGVLYAGVGVGRGLMVSYDDGYSWSKIELGVEELEGGELYDITSIAAVSTKQLYLGCKTLKAGSLEVVYEVIYDDQSSSWKVIEHKFPEELAFPAQQVVVKLRYDPDFHGEPVLFVSRYPDGLYIVKNLDGEWSWQKIFDGNTTAIEVALDQDVVYLGTYDDWIYRGVYEDGSWSWQRLNPLEGRESEFEVDTPPIISDVKVDPYNSNRIWWCSPGRLARVYPVTKEHVNLYGVGAWDPDGKRWLHSFVHYGWGTYVAIDRHGEGESPESFMVKIDGVVGAKIAYMPSYSFRCLLKTEDGGRTWRSSYNKLYGDCINEVSLLDRDPYPDGIAVLCVSGIELSYDYGESWDDDFDLNPGGARLCFPWRLIPLPQIYGYKITVDGVEYPLDLMVITGYPGPSPEEGTKRHGLIALSSSFIKSHRLSTAIHQGSMQLTSNPAVYGLAVEDCVVLTLQEAGVEVYNLTSRSSFISNMGLPSSCELYKIAYAKIGSDGWWVVSTYEGPPIHKLGENDHYFWFGPSRIYRAKNLLESREDTVWQQISQRYDGGIVSLNVNNQGELIALETSGKVLYCQDFTADNPSWKELQILLVEGGEPDYYTDMEVDWEDGVAFISTVGHQGPGVCYVSLEDIRSGVGALCCHSFNEGLYTRLIRNILWSPKEKYLFAGSWWSSVWRVKVNSSALLQKVGEQQLTITCQVSPQQVKAGKQVTISGQITPAVEGIPVQLKLTKPDGSISEVYVETSASGAFMHTFSPDMLGEWHVTVACGVSMHTASFTVAGVEVEVKADINGDGVVNWKDFKILKFLYGARKGSAKYKPFADLNGDGVIDVVDLALLARQYTS